jgi:broad-specificity NMP kinase
MVCGKIGAGKSTLTRRLAAAPNTVLISEDDWLTRLYPNEIHVIADYVRCAGRLRHAMAGHVVIHGIHGLHVVPGVLILRLGRRGLGWMMLVLGMRRQGGGQKGSQQGRCH